MERGNIPLQPAKETVTDEDEWDIYVNPEQTMKLLAPRKPMTLNELREKNPQLAVDYLFQRKEKWKAAAIRLNNRVKDLLVEIQTVKNGYGSIKQEIERRERETKHWKRKHRQEVDMKKWWRNAFAISAGITAVTIVAMMLVTIQTATSRPDRQYAPPTLRVPTSGNVQQTPTRVLASTLIYNGNRQGSGTVISKGEKYAAILTAAHNFNGKIGGEFWIYYPDGTFTQATLIAHDVKRDLALARVDASTILSHSFVPKEMPASSSFTYVGYSNNQGPNMNSLSYNSTYKDELQTYLWDISLINATITGGASGGGVFLSDACIGVTTKRGGVYNDSKIGQVQKISVVCHQEVVNFLNEHKKELAECGDWSTEPEGMYGASENSPPPWAPNSNVPINVPGSNLTSLRQDVENLKEAVFGAQRRPSDIPSLPTAPNSQTSDEEPAAGQRLPSEVDNPPSPDGE